MKIIQSLVIFSTLFIFSCKNNNPKDFAKTNQTIGFLQKEFLRVLKTNKDSTYYFLNETQKLISSKTPDSLMQEFYYQKGVYNYRVLKNTDTAFYYFEKAISLSKDSMTNKREINYYYNLAKYYKNEKKVEDALYTLNRFKNILDKKKNFRELSFLHNLKYQYFLDLKLNDSAFVQNNKAIYYTKLNKDTLNYIINNLNKSNLLFTNNKEKATFKLLDSLRKIKLNHFTSFLIENTYASILKLKKKYNIALLHYQKALENIKKDNYQQNTNYRFEVINNLIKLNLKLKRNKEAKKLLHFLDSNKTQLNSKNKKEFLTNKLNYYYNSRKEFDSIKVQLDTLFNFLLNRADTRLNAKFSALEKANKKEKQLLIKQQKIELKNKNLQQQKIIFYSLAALLFMVLIIIILWYNKQKIQQSRDELLMQQRLFRAQMNPHFTSNVLFAMQNLLKKDPILTEKYLIKFSRLLRIIFSNSTKDYVPLEDELEAIEKYLELQQLRFKDKFDYQIKIENTIDVDMIKIPPMLIQPFVENAIEHGFKQMDKKGIVKISLTLADKYLTCTVIDNGCGMEIKNPKKTSSTKLIKELIFKLTGKHIRIKTNKNQGTTISFKIPFIFET